MASSTTTDLDLLPADADMTYIQGLFNDDFAATTSAPSEVKTGGDASPPATIADLEVKGAPAARLADRLPAAYYGVAGPTLPLLLTTTFDAFYDFLDDLRRFKQTYPTLRLPPVAAMLHSSIQRLICVNHGLKNGLPADDKLVLKLVALECVPTDALERARILSRLNFRPQHSRVPLATQLALFYDTFVKTVTLLGFKEDNPALVRLFSRCLHGHLREHLDALTRINKPESLAALFSSATELAHRFDLTAVLLPGSGPAASHAMSSEGDRARRVHVASPPVSAAGAFAARRRDGPHVQKLTPEEYARCKREGLCLRCRRPGHRAADCKAFKEGDLTTSSIKRPAPSTAMAPPLQSVASATSTGYGLARHAARPDDRSHPPRRSSRERNPPQRFPAPEFRRDRQGAPPASSSSYRRDAAPSSSSSSSSSARPLAAIGSAERHASPATARDDDDLLPLCAVGDGQDLMRVPPSKVQGDKRPFLCCKDARGIETRLLLDSGAAASFTSRRYASQLGLVVHPCPPQRARLADNKTLVAYDQCCTLSIALSADAPVRDNTVYILSGDEPADYVILGFPGVRGFTVTFGDHVPKLDWLGTEDPLPDVLGISRDPDAVPESPVPTVEEGVATPEQSAVLRSILARYADTVFGPLNREPARLRPFTVVLKPGAEPVCQAPRRATPAKVEATRAQIQKWAALDIVEPCVSPWSSPVTLALKRNGEWRTCVDYTKVNALTVKDAFPLPAIPDLFQHFRDCPWMASFDFVSGYNQAPLAVEARDILAFVTADGLYRFKRLPFGVMNGPSYFQRTIADAFKDLRGVVTYQDDIGACEKTFERFCDLLVAILDRCEELNLKMRGDKCRIAPVELPYLGMLVGPQGVRIDPERMRPLVDMAEPRTKDNVRSFLGLAQYFARFLPNFAMLAAPLWDLVKHDSKFVWGDAQHAAFRAIVDGIAAAQPLAHADPSASLILRTDASSVGVGGALLQKRAEGTEEPILFFSRKLAPAEQHYATIELEALAILQGLEKARPYVFGPITIYTDHSNLRFLRSSANKRLQRWALLLNEFDLVIHYTPGRTNCVADALSRLLPSDNCHEGTDVSVADRLPTASAGLAAIAVAAPLPSADISGDADSLRNLVELLGYDQDAAGVMHLRERPDADMVAKIFALGHASPFAGHYGIDRTLARIGSVLQWPGMDADVGQLVKTCVICQKLRARRHPASDMFSTAADFPFQTVFLDYIGPLRASKGFKYVLTMIDRFSRYVELAAVTEANARNTARAIIDVWITEHGVPHRLSTDGGSHFDNEAIANICRELEVEHHIGTSHHPESQGVVERANAVVVNTLRALVRAHGDEWSDVLPLVRFAMNTSVSRTTGFTPYEVVHGFKARLPLHNALGLVFDEDDPSTFSRRIYEIYEQCREAEAAAFKAARDRLLKANRRRRADYDPGDYVLAYDDTADKLSPPWRGPYLVLAKPRDLVYELQDITSGRRFNAHVNRLHAFYPGTLTERELRAEALKTDQYYVDLVHEHLVDRHGQWWFRVRWLGYDEYARDDTRGWVLFADCRNDDTIKAYIRDHRLRPVVRPSAPVEFPVPARGHH